ncbi:MAG: hypothetical protein L0H41_11535 [Microlunatus sp.]|nr:hypothetical protein [Microlunatus sp.]MDN5804916.1 hypothetical protein [Microlunatus sp.]
MRASAETKPTTVVETVVEVVPRRRLPRPVRWLLWVVAALAGSVVLGFLAGLARPREPDPWSYAPLAESYAPLPEKKVG